MTGWLLSPLETKRKPKLKVSSDSRQGALVGAFVGLIHGIVVAIVFYFVLFPVIMPLVTKQLENNPRFASDPRFISALPRVLSILSTIMSVSVVLFVPIGALFGCVLGVLFVKFRRHIPSSSIVRKSMVVAFILVTISFLGILRNLLVPTTTIVFGADFFPSQLKSFALTLIEFPLLGWLFGYLLTRKLGRKQER